jgi:hypothetical protein
MSALSFSAGERMKNEFFLEKRFQIAHKQMMDDAVSKISRPYFPNFRIGDGKANILSLPIGSVFEFHFQIKKIFFKINLEFCGTRASPLRFSALVVGLEKILKRKNFVFTLSLSLSLSLSNLLELFIGNYKKNIIQ